MSEARAQYASFWVADDLYGIEVGRVREVLREQAGTAIPMAPPAVAGLINLRGQVITAIDLHHRLAAGDTRPPRSMIVVVLVDGESMALLVDRIGDVVEVTGEQFEPPPDTLAGPIRDLVPGAFKLDDRLLLRLNVEAAVAA